MHAEGEIGNPEEEQMGAQVGDGSGGGGLGGFDEIQMGNLGGQALAVQGERIEELENELQAVRGEADELSNRWQLEKLVLETELNELRAAVGQRD